MSKWTVLPRSGAANESLPGLPRAHAPGGTRRVNTSSSGTSEMGDSEKNELSDWKEWMTSAKLRRQTKAFFKPHYRRIAAMNANTSISGRPRNGMVRKEHFTDAEKKRLFYKKLLEEFTTRRKCEMQDRAETPRSDERWQGILERLGPLDACGAIKDLNETVMDEVMSVDVTEWFQELEKRLHVVGKDCVPKEKPTATVSDDGSEDLSLPEMSTAMLEEVAAVLEPEPATEVLVSGFRLNISRSDMGTLDCGKWLNDEVINFYLSLIMERSGTEHAREKGWPRVYAFNTFFYPKLAASGYGAVKRWTRTVDLFSYDILLVPLHCTMHWCLAAVDFRKCTIRYYDSYRSKGEKDHFLLQLQQYVEDESQGKKNIGIDWNAWEFDIVEDLPQQGNLNDCGVFICQYSECLSRDAPMEFGQQHMPYFRKRMVYEIVHKALLPV